MLTSWMCNAQFCCQIQDLKVVLCSSHETLAWAIEFLGSGMVRRWIPCLCWVFWWSKFSVVYLCYSEAEEKGTWHAGTNFFFLCWNSSRKFKTVHYNVSLEQGVIWNGAQSLSMVCCVYCSFFVFFLGGVVFFLFVCLTLVLLKLDPPEWLCTWSVPWTKVATNKSHSHL